MEGEACNGRVELFAHLAAQRQRRDPSGQQVTACLFDGEPVLWDEWLEWLGDILDIFPVPERRHQRPAADGDQARAERVEGAGVVGGGEQPGGQPGPHALRRVPVGGLPDRQWRSGGSVPSSGEGPSGANGDALDGSGGAGVAAPAGDAPQRGASTAASEEESGLYQRQDQKPHFAQAG